MAWHATLASIGEVLTVTDSIDINVDFADAATGRGFTKTYKLSATNFPTLQSVRDAVRGDVASLTSADQVAANLAAFVGRQID